MKSTEQFLTLFTLVLALTLSACGPTLEAQAEAAAAGEELYYGIEMGGNLCGYSHLITSPLSADDGDGILLTEDVVVKASLLGAGLDSDTTLVYHLDPEGRRFSYFASETLRGPNHLTAEAAVEGDVVRFNSSFLAAETTVRIDADTVLENTLYHPHLKADFVERGREETTYRVFESADAAVQEVTYRRVGDETLELLGRSWEAVALDRINRVTGSKARMWIDRERGFLLQARRTGEVFYYLTDAAVPERIVSAALDERILHPTEVSIADIQAISYMKVRARLEPQGLWITPESLDVPGQRFTGTVEENLIDGVFEIEHPRYDGDGAPPFPPDFSGEPELERYLRPRLLIEADDAALVARAQQITAGADDSWQAATRIARWVSANVEYALPGGLTARGVYDLRAGECGGHSVLVAALCNGVGIPARMVWGAMYAPNRGGAFGQHGWTEVYMGAAGWVPLDATAAETDYLDSGHIRLGVWTSMDTALNPIDLEVLDYRVGAGAEGAGARYVPYVGEYMNQAAGLAVEIRVQDGALTLDIPNNAILAFHDPDADGRWFAKLSDRLFVTFDDGSGGDGELRLHEQLRMRRTGTPEDLPDAAPPKLLPYLGTYHLAKAQIDFEVLYDDGGLALRQPGVDRPIRLESADVDDRWIDEHGRHLRFEPGEKGGVEGLALEVVTPFERTGVGEAGAQATDLSKQKATVVVLRRVGTAFMSWLTDHAGGGGTAPPPAVTDPAPGWSIRKQGSETRNPYALIAYPEVSELLVPGYIDEVPEKDAWGHPYQFVLNADRLIGHVLGMRSAGRDGRFETDDYVIGDFASDDFDRDLVWGDGYFARWPTIKTPGDDVTAARKRLPKATAPGEYHASITQPNTYVNEFTPLTRDAKRGSRSLSVSDAGLNAHHRFENDLGEGDLILVIQMQGAILDGEPTDESWGRIEDYANCGNWELRTVAATAGGATIELADPLAHDYDVAGKAQIVRVPRYGSMVIQTGAYLTTEAWNGGSGGVLAISVDENLTIEEDAMIDASGLGFRGGEIHRGANSPQRTGRLKSTRPADGAEKGESIAGYKGDYSKYGGMYCYGAAANGGGGGNSHNAAGGGGANAGIVAGWTGNGNPDLSNPDWEKAWDLEFEGFSRSRSSGGGRGGYSWSNRDADAIADAPGASAWSGDGRRPVGGLGGRPLDTSSGRLFLGGGGGAGEANGPNGTPGANGGGLILIRSNGSIEGEGTILANGGDVRPTATLGKSAGDGPGGGGAGGSIVIDAKITRGIAILANGGRGGDQRIENTEVEAFFDEAEGGGGGGGGGYVSLSGDTEDIRIEVEGGRSGVTDSPALTEFPPNGATAGGPGIVARREALADLSAAAPPHLADTAIGMGTRLEGLSPEATLTEWAAALGMSTTAEVMAFYQDSEQVLAIESTGRVYEGFAAIREMYDETFAELTVEKAALDVVDVNELGNVAWAAVDLRIDSLRLADRSRWILEVKGSFVLERTGDSWKIVQEHFSTIEGIPRWRQG